jgi:hypothetical protein
MTPRKSYSIVLILFFMYSLFGCAIHRDFYPYYDSPPEVYEQNANPVLWQKVTDLEKQNQLRKETDAVWSSRMSSFQDSLSKIEISLKSIQDQLRQLNAGLQQGDGSGREIAGEVGGTKDVATATTKTAAPLKKGIVATLKDETVDLQQRLNKLEEDSRKTQKEIEKTKVSTTMPSIVVVSGTGKSVSAKKMALRLSKLGYRVDRIAETPQNGYNKNVVFYAEPNRETATRLASRIGGKTIVKPMDWQSKYGIAVVSIIK